MLVNSKVKEVKLNTETGFCKVLMDNGEKFWGEDNYFPEEFLTYMSMLKEEDDLVFGKDTNWILITVDPWEEWKDAFESIGAGMITMIVHGAVERTILLKG